MFIYYLPTLESEVTAIIDRIGILTQRAYEIKVKMQRKDLNKLQKLIYVRKLKKIEKNLNDILNGK
ncbi:MAG: hypothetical protein IPG89_21665 [Bacteroidetes bacterium]|nr:hypothetical protein [Bacteroidota bacterium]